MSLPVAPETVLVQTSMHKGEKEWSKLAMDGCWPVDKLRKARALPGHAWKVTCAAWHPDSRALVSADQSGNVILWDAMSKIKLQYMNKPFVTAAAVSPDPSKTLVALGGLDNMITICDMAPPEMGLPTGAKELPTAGDGHDGSITALHFSAVDTVVSAAGDGDVRVWAVQSGKCSQQLEGHTRDAVDLSFAREAPGGPVFASGSLDGTVRLWDMRTSKAVAIFNATSEVRTRACCALVWTPCCACRMCPCGGVPNGYCSPPRRYCTRPHHLRRSTAAPCSPTATPWPLHAATAL